MQIASLKKIIHKTLMERYGVDIRKLHKMHNSDELQLYLKNLGLVPLGCGSSRCAYKFSPKRILKIALNDKGFAQNETEFEIWSSGNDVVAPIFDKSSNGLWIMSELVRPLTNENEFEKIIGIPFLNFRQILGSYRRGISVETSLEKLNTNVDRNWIVSVVNLMTQYKMPTGDLGKIEHWGKTSDGRLVLLDYGLTQEIVKTFRKR